MIIRRNPLKKTRLILITMVIPILITTCATADQGNLTTMSVTPPSKPDVILATTTSTQDSGILDYLLPIFEEATGYRVKPIAVGSGQALQMGREGNADVLLVHAPSTEKEFMDEGFGLERYLVMHNDFILIGPTQDLAGISGDTNVVHAFNKIFVSQSLFISRGDDSGTHRKELEIWELAGVTPQGGQGGWYEESGQGMGTTLRIASQKRAYTLSDRATYLANKTQIDLVVLLAGDKLLLNIYHVIVVNPNKWPKVNLAGSRAFAKFLTSPDTQALIGQFGIQEYGEPLFFPDADKTEAELGIQ